MGVGVSGEPLNTLPGTGEPDISRAPVGGANAFSMSSASATACCFGVPDDAGLVTTDAGADPGCDA
jgi:hypothetical protein